MDRFKMLALHNKLSKYIFMASRSEDKPPSQKCNNAY